ncbi:hypothetical protein BUZ67_11330 [Staphylococcus pasteuri]|nr:hypothetical protein BUZ67_11330 [Staphylococcus pasteuri]PTU82589.1 hypothetical protein BUZ66_05895 [Staphylococcus pasteuri]RIO37014.1 hypothetical protein BUZ65_03925 [Staphylococcus pasteuri]RIO39352.1 hypothetical protein BUZ63_08125 [Staphylococcus pasteuri]
MCCSIRRERAVKNYFFFEKIISILVLWCLMLKKLRGKWQWKVAMYLKSPKGGLNIHLWGDCFRISR